MLSEKFIKKYMRQAKLVGEDQNSCYSRHIGTIIVRVYEDGSSKLLGTGYNSPPTKTPHTDTREYLQEIFWPQLTNDEKSHAILPVLSNNDFLLKKFHAVEMKDEDKCELLCQNFADKGVCPRKLIGAASGKRLELCSCAHSENNAIINASDDLHGAYMFCYCPCPCIDCSKAIINAGIKKVFFCKAEKDYSFASRWLLTKAGVDLIEHEAEWYLN